MCRRSCGARKADAWQPKYNLHSHRLVVRRRVTSAHGRWGSPFCDRQTSTARAQAARRPARDSHERRARDSRARGGLRPQAARRPAARRPVLPQHLLRRDVEPRAADRLPAVQRRRARGLRARVPAAQAGDRGARWRAASRSSRSNRRHRSRDFDVFAFSVSFEWDYPNVVTMLRLAGLEPRAEQRHRARSARSSSAAPSRSSIRSRWRRLPT